MICAMDEFTLGPAEMIGLADSKTKNQRVKDALSSSMLPSHSEGSIRIKADETKTG